MLNKRERSVHKPEDGGSPFAINALQADRSAEGSVPASVHVSHETLPPDPGQGMARRRDTKPTARTVEEWVTWTYREQKARTVEDRLALAGQPSGHATRCSVARVAEAAALGAVIAGGGRSAALHPDAELVHETVMTALDPMQRGLVIAFGETGVVPDWVPGGLRIDRMTTPRGSPTYVTDEHRNPKACLFRFVCDPQVIAYRRHVYRVWWLSLSMLAILLREAGLKSCGDPTTPFEPWAPSPGGAIPS